jgi:hypothetical protein
VFLCPVCVILFLFPPHAIVSFTWVFICDISQKTVIYNHHQSHVFPAQNDLKNRFFIIVAFQQYRLVLKATPDCDLCWLSCRVITENTLLDVRKEV